MIDARRIRTIKGWNDLFLVGFTLYSVIAILLVLGSIGFIGSLLIDELLFQSIIFFVYGLFLYFLGIFVMLIGYLRLKDPARKILGEKGYGTLAKATGSFSLISILTILIGYLFNTIAGGNIIPLVGMIPISLFTLLFFHISAIFLEVSNTLAEKVDTSRNMIASIPVFTLFPIILSSSVSTGYDGGPALSVTLLGMEFQFVITVISGVVVASNTSGRIGSFLKGLKMSQNTSR